MPPRKKRPTGRASKSPKKSPKKSLKKSPKKSPKLKKSPAKAKPKASRAPKANPRAKAKPSKPTKEAKTAAKQPAPKTSAKKPLASLASAPSPRRSPIYGMSIADFIRDKLTGWQAEAVARLATIVREAAPDAQGTVKWGQPVFELSGPFAYVKPAGAHVTLGFWRGTELEDPEGVLEGDGDRMRHVKIPSLDAIDATILSPLVQQAVMLNREKGSPALGTAGGAGEEAAPTG